MRLARDVLLALLSLAVILAGVYGFSELIAHLLT
jgi:hypothetical protein